MKLFLNIFRVVLIALLSIIILLTLYFITDRYVFNSDQKGISPIDIKDILKILILPLTLMLIITIQVKKRIEK